MQTIVQTGRPHLTLYHLIRFSTFFYPHFPILDSPISIMAMSRSTPILFFTILTIVTGRRLKESHSELYNQLKEPFLNLLRTSILKAPLPLLTIKALLHLIMWPLSAERQPQEPSWLYCGIALNAASYMGLHQHKPITSLRSIGVIPGLMKARVNTWLGCFLAHTSYVT